MAEGEAGVASGQWPVASEEGEVEGKEEPVEVVAEGGMTPEKAPNEANLVSTQGSENKQVKSETRDLATTERSQMAAGERAARDAGTRGGKARVLRDQPLPGAEGESANRWETRHQPRTLEPEGSGCFSMLDSGTVGPR